MSEWPPLRDYGHSLAVLIGASDYEILPRVPAAGHSLRRMQGLLAGPLCGWPRDRMLVLENVPGPGDLPDQLISAFEQVSDVALFYFVGHGQIDRNDQLCLGLTRSQPELHRRAATSLRFSDVRQALRNGNAATKIVILDCCYAGLATRSTMAPPGNNVLDLTAGTGAYTMAATSAYTTAWYEDEPGLAEPQTYFTKYLADLVEEGIPEQPSLLRLDPLFKQLRHNLAEDSRPVPGSRGVNDAREFVFAHNAATPPTRRNHAAARSHTPEPSPRDDRVGPARRPRRRLLAIALACLILAAAVSVPEVIVGGASHAKTTLGTLAAALPNSASGGVDSVAFGPDGKTLAAGDHYGRTYLWDTTTKTITATLTDPHTKGVSSVAFGPDGKTLAAGDDNGSTYLWDVATKGRIATLTDPLSALSYGRGVNAVAFSPDGKTLAVGDSNGSIYLWDIATKTVAVTLTVPFAFNASAVAFSPDGKTLAVGSLNGGYAKTYLWDVPSGRPIATFNDPSGPGENYGVNAVAFSPDGKMLAAGDDLGYTDLWDVASGHLIAILNNPSGSGEDYGVTTVAFSPDGEKLAVGSMDSTYLWDVASRHRIVTLADPRSGPYGTRGVNGVTFSPSGKMLASGDSNGRIYLWDVG